MGLLSSKSSAVVAGGGMLSLHSHLQVCVLNTRTVDKRGVVACMRDGGGLDFTCSASQSCQCLLANEAAYTVSFALLGNKSDRLNSVRNDLCLDVYNGVRHWNIS